MSFRLFRTVQTVQKTGSHTKSRTDKISNGQNFEWTKSRIGQNPERNKIPNGQNPELDKIRKEKIPNRPNPEWITIQN